VRPAFRADPLVSVGIEDRGDEQYELVEVGELRSKEDVPGQHERSLFAFDFPGVDIGLDIDGPPASISTRSSERGKGISNHQERDVSSFRADG
jgi:hypothetical protein